MIAYVLLWVGGLNWLLVGVFGWDVGELFGGMQAAVSRIIYVLVGLSAIYLMATHRAYCKHCAATTGQPQM